MLGKIDKADKGNLRDLVQDHQEEILAMEEKFVGITQSLAINSGTIF